jgi:hypothetical protein
MDRLSALSYLAVLALIMPAGALDATTTAAVPSTSIVSILLPAGAPSVVHGSVVEANVTATVYVLGCAAPTNATTTNPTCGFQPPITLTEGPSTLIYTATPASDETQTNALIQAHQATTIDCLLVGADLSLKPIVPASQALCTGKVPVPGLGYLGSTSNLAADQITYVGVTVTAGVDKLVAASIIIDTPTTTPSSTGAAARATAQPVMAAMGWTGLLGALVGIL